MFSIAVLLVLVAALSRLSYNLGGVSDTIEDVAGSTLGSIDGHDITAAQVAGAAAAYYTGGAYGGAIAGGVEGGSAAGAAGGVAGVNALKPGDPGYMPPNPLAWRAADEYSKLSQAEADWYYNAEEHGKATNGVGWTKDQYKFAQAQYGSQQNRDKNLGAIDQWQQSRNPYYQSVYDKMNKGYDAQSQQAYGDSLKKMQLQHAGRGTLGSAQSEFNKSQLNSKLAQEMAGNHNKSKEYSDSIRGQDQQQAQSMRMRQYSQDPYVQAMYESMVASQTKAGSQNGNLADLYQQAIKNNQDAANSTSQIYGGQISGLTGTAATYMGS